MNDVETRAEIIDPKLKDSSRGAIEDTKVLREHHIIIGKIQTDGRLANLCCATMLR